MEHWDHIRFFLVAHRTHSFAAAARELHVKPSTVSRRVGALEEALGGSLFDRTPEGLSPTDLAHHILEHAQGAERHFHGLQALAQGHDSRPKGKVKIALTEAMANSLFIPALPAFLEGHPELEMELLTSTHTLDLMRREADVALRFIRPTEGDLIVKRVARMSLSVLGHRDFIRKIPESYCLEDLPWIGTELDGTRTPEVEWMQENIRRRPRLVTNSYLTQLSALQQKLGVACVVRCLIRGDLGLQEVPHPPKNMPVLDLWLVTHRALQRVPRIRAVWALLEQLATKLDDHWQGPVLSSLTRAR